MSSLKKLWPIAVVAAILATLLVITLNPYHGNVTALFHMGQHLASEHSLPKNFVVLDVPAYDGAQYYLIAKKIPKIFLKSHWPELKRTTPLSYAYQRILLPTIAYILSLGGRDALLSYAFLFINLFCLMATTSILALQFPKKWIYTLALALCPAAMVALHFSLAEPLNILLLLILLLRYEDVRRLDALGTTMLTLAVLTREVNIFVAAGAFVFFAITRKWQSAALTIVPIFAFLAWHTLLYGIFGDIPFLINDANRALPLNAPISLLLGRYGYNQYTYSSITLLVLFVIPAILWIITRGYREKEMDLPTVLFSLFLVIMLTMGPNIWGSITSIGRAITPVYPLFIAAALKHDTLAPRLMAIGLTAIGLATGLGLALIAHPYALT